MKNKKIKNYQFLFSIFLFFSSPLYAEKIVVIPEVHSQEKISHQIKAPTYFSSTQFNRTEIIKSPVVNLSQLFKQEQSVVRLTNNSGDASQTALSIRGFGDNAVANSLILVDGFPLTNPSLLAPNFNSIPLSDIERIDIFQGSAGSLWGNQAVGGVINITTKHPRKFFISSILNAGSYHTYYTNLLMGEKSQNGLFFKVFGLIGQTQNYRHHNELAANNVAAQIGWDYARGTISFNVQSYGDSVEFPGGLAEELVEQHPTWATNFKNNSHYRTHLFQVLSKHAIDDNWLLETRLAHQETEGNGFIYWYFNRKDALTIFNPRLLGNINNNKIILGYFGEFSNYQLNNTKIHSRTYAKQNDFYLQTTLPINSKTDIILGAREAIQTNQIEAVLGEPAHANNRAFVTEQGITYHPTNEISLFARRDGNFSFPKANEETWVPPNVKALNVQTGVSYEAGATWQQEKFKSQINLYRLALNNEIAFNPVQTPEQPFGAFNNLAKTVRYGLGLAENYQLTARTKINAQLNYVNARFASGRFAGKLIPAVPAINGNLGVDYDWNEHWVTQYALLYNGSRYASEDLANRGRKIPSYWLNDVALQYLIKSFIVSFEVHNLLNKNYSNYVFYNQFTQQLSYYPAAGRNYSLTLKIDI